MLTKEQAERIKELTNLVAKTQSLHDWQQDQSDSRVIKEAEEALSDAREALWSYIESLTEKPEPLPLKRFKVRYRRAGRLTAQTVLMDLPSIDEAWNDARKFAREQGPSCRIESIEEVES